MLLKDRIQQVTSTTGLGPYTLGATQTGFKPFSSLGEGITCYCCSSETEWEVGIGTYNGTLSRDTIIASSNGDNKVNWPAGDKQVYVTLSSQLFTKTFNQDNPASTWTIPHFFGRPPRVTVLDSGGNLVVPEVQHANLFELNLQFSPATAGIAYLS